MEPTITVVILAKNEAVRIGDCLKSVSWADEIIVIDNNSTDDTGKIARRWGAKVIHNPDDDFARLRTFGKQKASGKWILYVDADERVTSHLQKEIEQIVLSYKEGMPVGYYIWRQNYYLGFLWPEKDKMQRLFLRGALRSWTGKLHESAIVNGQCDTLNNHLTHETHRTLEQMVAKTNEWSHTEALLRFKVGHPSIVWWRFIRVWMTGFIDWYILRNGWRAGTVGWIEGLYQGFSLFITYAKLWEMQQYEKKA